MKKILTYIVLLFALGFAAFSVAAAQESNRQMTPRQEMVVQEESPLQQDFARRSIVFWNLENFFDYFDDATSSSDSDFSSRGSRRWTKKRFTAKCNFIGKTLLWMGESLQGGNSSAAGEVDGGSRGGFTPPDIAGADTKGISVAGCGAPDIVGVAEVENGFVLNRLVNSAVLRKMDYSYVHYDSPDRRGIDVALLYRRSRVRVLSSRAVHILSDSGEVMPTRDILYVEAEFIGGSSGGASRAEGMRCSGQEKTSGENPCKIHILVNHHPSKYSGSKASEHSRELAMRRLRAVCDSIRAVSGAPIVAMGDFNDTPSGKQFKIIEGVLENLAAPLSERGEGSIRFNGRWELIDHFLVDFPPLSAFQSPNDSSQTRQSMSPTPQMKVLQPPFLMIRDKTHVGFKPQRTYTGPRYTAGVSDHLPILLLLQ